MKKLIKDPVSIYAAILVLIGVAMFAGTIMSPVWTWATSTWTDRFGMEMPERGDVGWDDAIRINHKMFEVVAAPMLDGHCVKTGVTPSYSGIALSWSAGTVVFGNGEYTIAAGVTNLANNTINFISAVTMVGSSGATIEVRSTEYYPPSTVSGYYTPIAVAYTEAGSIVRMKDLRFRPPTVYRTDQDLNSGVTPTFAGVKVTGPLDARTINALSGITVPTGTTPPAVPPSGALFVDTNDKLLSVGVDGTQYAMPLTELFDIVIPSPDLLDSRRGFPIWTSPSGVTTIISGLTVYTDTSGVSIPGIEFTLTPVNYQFGTGVTLFKDVTVASIGTSIWAKSFASGASAIPPDRGVQVDFGYSTPGYVRVKATGRFIGAR